MIRNLTPHAVTLITASGPVVIPAEPVPARVLFMPDIDAGAIDLGDGRAVPLVFTQLGTDVTGLPGQEPDVTLLVSRQVVEACPDRTDLVFVHRVCRGPDGQPVAAQALARPAP